MSAADQPGLKQALYELSELPEALRVQRLAQLRLRDPALAAELSGLLDGLLSTLPALDAPRQWASEMQAQGLPQRLGPWRVLGEIGRGGMGLVLLGERADGAFDKQVAIKVLPPALFGQRAAERLATEARLLARLEHPHIARLLDAGFDGGCAYLVMEHVDGQHLVAHAQQARLDWRERLQLLLQLCTAVQFAHGQLLVHRDLKPANVLVDGRGQVRLLDFGIAQVLSPMAEPGTRQGACTPAYASPEQLLGQPVSVASDVFSLGVVAWELLTGGRPFGPADTQPPSAGNTLAIVRAVLESDPDASQLQRLPVDLRAVLVKALDKDPRRRHASAEALAADLQAVLDGRPVSARAPSLAYRSQRFVRRHRWAVGTATLATASVLGLTGWALVSAEQARQQQALAQARLQSVRAIANRVVYDYNRLLEPVPGTLQVRQTLVADALGYLQALGREARDDAALQADVAQGFESVGDVQGRGATGGNLGDLPGAQRSYEQALALREPACQRALVLPASVAAAGAAASAASAATAAASAPRAACAALARTRLRLGDNAFTQVRPVAAVAHFDAALLAADRALATAHADTGLQQEAQDARFDALQRLAGLSLRQTGAAYARGADLARSQLAAAQAQVALAPGLKSLENLRVAQDFLAVRLLADGHADEALAAVQAAIDTARRLRDQRPSRDAGIYLATSLSRLAEIQAHRLQAEPARAAAAESLAIVRALHQAEPDDRHLRARLANIGRRYGQVHNLIADARALADNARELPLLLQVSSAFTPADGVFFHQHQQLLLELAETRWRQGDAAAAAQQLAHLPAQLPPQPRAANDLIEPFLLRAQVRLAQGQTDLARADAQQAIGALQAQLQATPSHAMAAARLAWAQAWLARLPDAGPAGSGALAATQASAASAAPVPVPLAVPAPVPSPLARTPWWQRALAAVSAPV